MDTMPLPSRLRLCGKTTGLARPIPSQRTRSSGPHAQRRDSSSRVDGAEDLWSHRGAALVGLLAACRYRLRLNPRWFFARRSRAILAAAKSSSAADADTDVNMAQDDTQSLKQLSRKNVIKTVQSVAVWSLASMALSFLFFPLLQRVAWALLVGSGGPVPLSDPVMGYVGNFLALVSLLFSILAGGSYAALYSQNEAIFYALFAEVSEAKALMEQVSLVCSGRPFFRSVLENIQRYVERDLRRLDRPPAVLVAMKPRDDPLESILYLTSVGVPSVVYETVRTLRQKRGDRLGARQRKLPPVQIALLYVLGMLNLLTFLLFGTCAEGAERHLCRVLFALLAGAMMMTMRVIHELWNPAGGAYNVDGVLAVMVRGLEDELQQRLQGRTFSDTRLPSPPPRWQGVATEKAPALPAAPVTGAA
eukprot:CAMPEP_0170581658 /NCGR_PEP_ID=MMETSP0224-20130122/7159_1 /TAXON_ID=285029 /ORGANISM="Togula jolla, Strain CCCM 725" /LENGTH=418 /DNA_ID=CAMNT_0010904813 /DNA_START=1 /DNA_END=1257 /DNA_ORIENTATION=+